MITDELMKIHSKLAESAMILKDLNHDLLWTNGFKNRNLDRVEYLKSYLADVESFLKSENKIS